MAKILEVLGCRQQAGDIGVEIEVEADNLPHPDSVSDYWRTERDNSLRGHSAEYVLNHPYSIDKVEKALDLLQAQFFASGTRVRPTYRAGIHVHVNVQDLTPKQLITFVASYLMLEEVLIGFCDKTRAGNHFCLRLSDAGYLLDVLTSAIKDGDLNRLNTEDIRYASINLTSLFKYGSVEFRALESTFDKARILNWAGALKHLKDFAKTVVVPTDILGEASAEGFEEYARKMLGPYSNVYAPWISRANIETGVRNIQFALFSRTWDKPELNIFKKSSVFSS